MCKSRRVYDDRVDTFFARFVNAVDEDSFMISLEVGESGAGRGGLRYGCLLDV
jgi:hypothetical protein